MRQIDNYALRIIEQNGGSEMELSEGIKNEIVAAVSSNDFRQAVTKSVVDILNTQNEQLSKVSFIERQKQVQSNTYKSTERLGPMSRFSTS